ncbi:MAG: hypothetical protein GXP45_02070 [bacterium]|nr:hypothetical protein [bacterium]
MDEVANIEHILFALLKVDHIVYVRKHEDIPSGYQTKQVIDILLGLKKKEHMSNKDQYILFQSQIGEKKEYMQYLRTLISSAAINGKPEIVLQKEKELEKLKQEIEVLEFELTKMKVKNKG